MTSREKHLTPAELAEQLEVKPSTLAMWRVKGTGPRFIKFGMKQQGRVRYASSEVDRWMAGSTHDNTGAFPAICHPSNTRDS